MNSDNVLSLKLIPGYAQCAAVSRHCSIFPSMRFIVERNVQLTYKKKLHVLCKLILCQAAFTVILSCIAAGWSCL